MFFTRIEGNLASMRLYITGCVLSLLFFTVHFMPVLHASEIFISPQLANTRESAQGSNGKTIVIVEEAHVVYNAQKALAEIIRDLVQNESLRYVFVEGGWDDVSLTSLRRLTDPEHRQEVAEQFLKEGKISGEEYVSLVSEFDIRLWGVEDPELYKANMNAFLKISSAQNDLLKELAKLNAQLLDLEPQMLPPSLAVVLSQARNFENQKINLLNYSKFLMQRLPGRAKQYPHLSQIMSLAGANGTYDSDKIALEKKVALQFLVKQLTKPEFETLLAVDAPQTLEDELSCLDAILTKVKELSVNMPPPALKNLSHYCVVLREASHMDPAALFREIEKASREAFWAGKPTPAQQTFFEIAWSAGMLEKLFALKLTETEFLTLEAGKTSFPVDQWNQFLVREFANRQLNYQPIDFKEITTWVPEAFSFYQTARAREKAMLNHLTREVQSKGIEKAAFITGGFHSKNFFLELKKQGYTVLLVSPRFIPEDDKATHEQYLHVLKTKWTGAVESETLNPKLETNPKTHLEINQISKANS